VGSFTLQPLYSWGQFSGLGSPRAGLGAVVETKENPVIDAASN